MNETEEFAITTAHDATAKVLEWRQNLSSEDQCTFLDDVEELINTISLREHERSAANVKALKELLIESFGVMQTLTAAGVQMGGKTKHQIKMEFREKMKNVLAQIPDV